MPPFGRSYETTTALADSYPSPWDVSWLPGDQNQVINAINSIVTDPSAGGSSDSGLAGHGSTILSYSLNSIAGNPAGVNPAFTLAMFRKEANFARPGTIAYNQNNPGNLRCAGYGMIDCQNGFAVFASMDDGIKAYFWMLQYQYKPGGGWPSNFNCADITCIITHYCPPSQCDTQGYIAQVGQWTQDFMARISSGGGTTPLTASWVSPSNGQTTSSGTVHLEASVSGGSGGGYEVAFSAKYSGNWHSVKPRSSSTSFDWNMCSSGVPDGDIELGLEAWDSAGSHYVFSEHNPGGNYHINKSGCPTYTHLECQNGQCVRVSGAGTDQCSPEGSSCGAGDGVELCDGTYYGQPCQIFPVGDYANLNDYGWYDRAESARFVGNCRDTRCHAVISTETNFSGNPIHMENNDYPDLGDCCRNHIRSLHIYRIDNPPGKPHDPSPSSGATLAPTTSLDISFQADGDQFQIHAWGNNYDRWRNWDPNRGMHLDGLTPGQAYRWQAQAQNRWGTGSWSDEWTFTIQSAVPSPPVLQNPTNGAVFNEGDSITLSWSATGDQYYGEIWGGPGGTLTFGWQTGTSKNIGTQWAGYTYSWHVEARNSSGPSGWSSTWTFTVKPATPTNLNTQAVSCNQVNLTWSDNSGNEEGYKVYRNGSYVGQVGMNTTSYQDTGLSENTTYSYYVKAFRGSIESDASNTMSATTTACRTVTVDSVSISDVDGNPSTTFYTGDQISFGIGATNHTGATQASSWWWTTYNSSSTKIQSLSYDNWQYTMPPGWSGAGWPVTIPSDLPEGTYRFVGTVQIGSDSDSKEMDFVIQIRPATNDDFDSPKQISILPYTDIMDTTGATSTADDPALYMCDRGPGVATVWYRFTPSTTGHLRVDTLGSNYDTMLAVWAGTRGNLQMAACNDDLDWPANPESSLVRTVSAGTTYYIEVAEYGSSLASEVSSDLASKSPASGVGVLAGGTLQLNARLQSLCSSYDLNENGKVDAPDIQTLASSWRQVFWPPYDCDGDSFITVKDVMCTVTHWGEICP